MIKKFQFVAQIVGYATIALLAVYGLVTFLGGSPVLATALNKIQAANPVIPATFNYQGLLRNPDGSLTTGVYTITAKIYAMATGGSALYTETFKTVTVRDGLFNIVLGDNPQGQDLQAVFNATPRYIGITLIGQGAELIPRQRLHSAPWALYATNALTATTLVPNATVNGLVVNGNLSASGNLAVTGDVRSAHTVSGVISTTLTTKSYVDFHWPDGHYCILRAGGSCPAGFSTGAIFTDGEDDKDASSHSGTVGDSSTNVSGSTIQFCCK